MSGVKLCADCGKGITGRRKYCPECVENHQRAYADQYRRERRTYVAPGSQTILVLQPGVAKAYPVTQAWLETHYADLEPETQIIRQTGYQLPAAALAEMKG